MADLEKAVFEVYENEKASQPVETVSVLFNPSEYTISGGADYKSSKDKSGTKNTENMGKENYQGSQKQTLSVELFFDTSGKRILGQTPKDATDVSKVTTKFMAMTRPKGTAHMPPVVCFKWGSLHFRGYVSSITAKYTMFTSAGMPVRANVSLSIIEVRKEGEKYMEPFESPDRTKARTVTDAVSVFNMAQAEYGDADMWRIICQANNIADPLNIPSGTVLKVPALD